MKYFAFLTMETLRLFELLAKRDPVLMELKNRIIKHNKIALFKQHNSKRVNRYCRQESGERIDDIID